MTGARDPVHNQRGAAIFEFALVVSLVFLPFVFGVIEFGRLSWMKTTVTAAAREGVRYAIVHGAESGATADSAAVSDYVKARTQLSPITVRPSWTPDKAPGDTVYVQVTYTYVPIVRIIPSKTLTSTSKGIIAF
jgi:Flp pilus assembly protein TadG